MKRFGLRAVLFAVAALVAQASTAKALPGDAVEDRVRERLNGIYGTGPLPPTAGYSLTELTPNADNWWQDANGLTVNGLRVISADTLATPDNRTLQTVGFYDNGGTFQQLVSTGNAINNVTGLPELTSYTPQPGNTFITSTTPGTAGGLLNSQGANASYTTNTFTNLAPFEFGVLTDRTISGAPNVGANQVTVNAGGTQLLGSDRNGANQFRAYRLITNQNGEPPQPDGSASNAAYVLVFYNLNTPTGTIAADWSGAGSTGGLVAFIVTGVVNPEPGSMILLATGLVGIAGYRLRRKRAVPTEISVS